MFTSDTPTLKSQLVLVIDSRRVSPASAYGLSLTFQQRSCFFLSLSLLLSFCFLFSFCFLTRKSDSVDADSTPWSYIRLSPSTRLVNLEAVYEGQR